MIESLFRATPAMVDFRSTSLAAGMFDAEAAALCEKVDRGCRNDARLRPRRTALCAREEVSTISSGSEKSKRTPIPRAATKCARHSEMHQKLMHNTVVTILKIIILCTNTDWTFRALPGVRWRKVAWGTRCILLMALLKDAVGPEALSTG